MPKATMEEEEKWKLPEAEPLSCILKAVTEKEIEYNDRKTGEKKSFVLWTWELEVVEGEYSGLRIWEDTDPKFTTHPDNKPRQLYEALTGVQLDLGQGVDTDDLLGLPCVVTVKNITVERAGKDPFYKSALDQVFPIDAAPTSDPWAPTSRPADEEPPF